MLRSSNQVVLSGFFAMLALTSTVWVPVAQAGGGLKEGVAAPAIEGTDAQGAAFSLAKAAKQNKVVIIDFWASWCEPCKEELPFLNKLYKEFKGKGLQIVGINIDSTVDKMNGFLKGKGIEFPVLHDPKGKGIASRYEPPTMPTSYVVDSSGKIVHVHRGFLLDKDGPKMRAEVVALVGNGAALQAAATATAPGDVKTKVSSQSTTKSRRP